MWCSPLKPGNIAWHQANQLPRCDVSPMLTVGKLTSPSSCWTFATVSRTKMCLSHIFTRWRHPVQSRVALFPLSCRFVRFDQILLNRCSARTCVHIRSAPPVGIVGVSFTRSVLFGALLPAPDLSVVSALLCSHGVFLPPLPSPQGNAIGNVIAYSSGSEQCIGTTAPVSFG